MPILVEQLTTLPEEVAILLIAAIPIAELRAAIPAGLSIFNLSWPSVLIFSVLGNILPLPFILFLLEPLSKILQKKSKWFNKFFTWLFERTRHKFYEHHAKWGDLALVIFVAIPLPMTGAWSGAIAAFLFGIPFWRALLLISLGVIIAGIIVTALSLGVISIF